MWDGKLTDKTVVLPPVPLHGVSVVDVGCDLWRIICEVRQLAGHRPEPRIHPEQPLQHAAGGAGIGPTRKALGALVGLAGRKADWRQNSPHTQLAEMGPAPTLLDLDLHCSYLSPGSGAA